MKSRRPRNLVQFFRDSPLARVELDLKREAKPNSIWQIEETDEAALYLSVLTLSEIRKGAARLAHGCRRTRLETWLESICEPGSRDESCRSTLASPVSFAPVIDAYWRPSRCTSISPWFRGMPATP
jgi:hypothetical protein